MDPLDPYGDVGLDVCHFNTQGELILMGDMNYHIGNIERQPISWNELDKHEQIDITPTWQRIIV